MIDKVQPKRNQLGKTEGKRPHCIKSKYISFYNKFPKINVGSKITDKVRRIICWSSLENSPLSSVIKMDAQKIIITFYPIAKSNRVRVDVTHFKSTSTHLAEMRLNF